MTLSGNEVIPGSDGLRILVFWKTRQLGLDCGPVELVVEWGPVELESWLGPCRELRLSLDHGVEKLKSDHGVRQISTDRDLKHYGIRSAFMGLQPSSHTVKFFGGPDQRRWKEIWNSTRYVERLSFVSIAWYERLLRIVCLSLLVSKKRTQKSYLNNSEFACLCVVYFPVFEFVHVPLDWLVWFGFFA